MKKSRIFMASLLLQASCLPFSHAWTPEEENIFQNACGEVPITRIYNPHESERTVQIHPHVNALSLHETLPVANVGSVRPVVTCRLGNQEERHVRLPQMPLVSADQWRRDVDPQTREDVLRLSLGFMLNRTWREVRSIERRTRHQREDEQQDLRELPTFNYRGGHFFQGFRDHYARFIRPHDQGGYYNRIVGGGPHNPPGHQGRIVHVEAFTPEGDLLENPCHGEYRFIGSYQGDRLHREEGRFLYSNGEGRYHIPHITQDRWELINRDLLNADHPEVIFFMASLSPSHHVSFVEGVTIPNLYTVMPQRGGHGFLREGLYQLMASGVDEHHPLYRVEQWRKLEPHQQNNETFNITFPHRFFSSLPGMGGGVPRVLSLEDLPPAILPLRQRLDLLSRNIDRQRHLYPDAQSQVVILGGSGSGKSTFITGLAGRPLRAEGQDPRDPESNLILDTDDPLPHIRIYGGADRGTDEPTVWYDEVNRILYWDCPGFRDPRGGAQDLLNACMIFKVFTPLPTRVLWTVPYGSYQSPRYRDIYDPLRLLTSLFKEREDFYRSLGVVATGFIPPVRRGNPHPETCMRKAYEALQEAEEVAGQDTLLPLLRRLHENRDTLVFSFNGPEEEGDYEFDQENFTLLMDTVEPQVLDINLNSLVREAGIYVNDLYHQLITSLTQFIEETFIYQILHGYRQMVEAYRGSVVDLRTRLQGVLSRINTLNQVRTQDDFLRQLSTLTMGEGQNISTQELHHLLDQLVFIENLGGPRQHQNHFREWMCLIQDGLRPPLELLCRPPTRQQEGLTLTVQGPLVGIRDLVEWCEAPEATFTSLQVLVGCKFFFDQNLTLRGKNMSIVSPMGHIHQECILDLSGLEGDDGLPGNDPGGHGNPGGPGGIGGNFVGFFNHLTGHPQTMTLNLKGGKGGTGGKGSRGASGLRGQERPIPDFDGNHTLKPFMGLFPSGSDSYYIGNWGIKELPGTPGTPGTQGGKGGTGGLGGPGGHFSLHPPLNVQIQSQQGERGQNGDVGPGGFGGRIGPYRFIYPKTIHLSFLVERTFWIDAVPSIYQWIDEGWINNNSGATVNEVKRYIAIRNGTQPAWLCFFSTYFFRERSAEGAPGEGLHGIPLEPAPPTPLQINPLREIHTAYINEQNQNLTGPFLGFPPSLEDFDPPQKGQNP